MVSSRFALSPKVNVKSASYSPKPVQNTRPSFVKMADAAASSAFSLFGRSTSFIIQEEGNKSFETTKAGLYVMNEINV